jgi:antitoxin VapB
VETAKVFMSGRSQAVRLPKAYRFDDTEVVIRKVGEAVVLLPRKRQWKTMLTSLALFEPGFRIERQAPVAQQERTAIRK